MANKSLVNPVERIANTLSNEEVTEADPLGIELMLLTALSNRYGKVGAKFGSKIHPTTIFIMLIGETSIGRKGEIIGISKKVLMEIDPVFVVDNMYSGFRTGAGLIDLLRGETEDEFINRLIIEEELAPLFKDSRRPDGNLSEICRKSFDEETLMVLTLDKKVIRNYKVCIVGCITPVELESIIKVVDKHNGLLNRFLMPKVEKKKTLPFPNAFKKSLFAHEIDQLKQSLVFAESLDVVHLAESAKKRWSDIYSELDTVKQDACLGPLISRAETQIPRLAGIIAITELSKTIEIHHLDKAYELWQHCKISVDETFCSRKADKNLNKLLNALESSKSGLTLGQIRNDVFSRNKSQKETAYYLGILEKRGLAKVEKISTKGRPFMRWIAIKPSQSN